MSQVTALIVYSISMYLFLAFMGSPWKCTITLYLYLLCIVYLTDQISVLAVSDNELYY